MKTIQQIKAVLIMAVLLIGFGACSSTQSLQEYYVDNSENPNFISVDIPVNILKLEEAELSATQKEAISSLRKLNILAFRKTVDNATEYKTENSKVKAILKNSEFKDLMRLKTSFGNGVIKYEGDTDAIDEVIIYGDNDDKGFAVIRVLGKNMNPAHFMQLMQALQKSDFDGEGFKEIANILKS